MPSTRCWSAWRERARPEFSLDAAAHFAEAAGLSLPEAKLLFTGMPNAHDYQANFLSKETREVMKLKMTDARAARDSLSGLPKQKTGRALHDAAERVPESLYDPTAFAEALAATWREQHGERVSFSLEVAAAAKKAIPVRSQSAVAALEKAVAHDELVDVDLGTMLRCAMFLFHHLPVGAQYRDAIPRLVERVRRYLDDPKVHYPSRPSLF